MQKEFLNKDTLKQFISDNRLNEVIKNLIFQLNEFLNKNENNIDYELIRKLSDALIINSGKLNSLEYDKILGIPDRETQRITTAEVQNAILYIIEQLPKNFWDYSYLNVVSFDKQKKVIDVNDIGQSEDNINSDYNLDDLSLKCNKSDKQSDYKSNKYSETNQLNYFIDERDGNKYEIIKIGYQTWFAENLRFKAPSGCWAYNNQNEFIQKNGYLYDWENAMKIIPNGWHLPSKDEWFELADYLGGVNAAGGKLKSLTDWKKPNNFATNEVGFSALPCGYRQLDRTFGRIGDNAYWWSSTPQNLKSSWYFYIYASAGYLDSSTYDNNYGFSVRCIKGEPVIKVKKKWFF